jgi:hypothetical protein
MHRHKQGYDNKQGKRPSNIHGIVSETVPSVRDHGSPEGQSQRRIELMRATFHECCRGQLDIIYDIILTDLMQSCLVFVTESDLS